MPTRLCPTATALLSTRPTRAPQEVADRARIRDKSPQQS